MRANITDQQQSSIISIVAKIPVAEARKPFLVELERQLPKVGKVTDERLLQAINVALKSFEPGCYCGDAQGAYPSDLSTLALKECADLYLRMCREVGAWSWPPKPLPTQEQTKAREAKLASMSQAERAEPYHRSLFNSDEEFERAKEAEEARREAEETADTTPWPLPAPPTTRTIRGEVEPDVYEEPEPEPEHFPTDDDLRKAAGQPEDEDQRVARAITEQLHRERLQRRRLQGATKCFFNE